MENIITQFDAGLFNVKLTDEKLVFLTNNSTESFALRSLNGIGVVDLTDDLNQQVLFAQGKKSTQMLNIVIGAIVMIFGFYVGGGFGTVMAIVGIVFIILGLLVKVPTPILKSVVRIMLSSGNRDFQFIKSSGLGSTVLDFVSKVEETLTAYHKR